MLLFVLNKQWLLVVFTYQSFLCVQAFLTHLSDIYLTAVMYHSTEFHSAILSSVMYHYKLFNNHATPGIKAILLV